MYFSEKQASTQGQNNWKLQKTLDFLKFVKTLKTEINKNK